MKIREFLEELDGAGLVITNYTELEQELVSQGYSLDREMSIEPDPEDLDLPEFQHGR